MTRVKCRCYINAKYYAKVASGKVGGTLGGYKPCPIHEDLSQIKPLIKEKRRTNPMEVTKDALKELSEEDKEELYKRARAAVASEVLGFNRKEEE